jgi:phosphoglycolate phosphatase-like HAD superfamily hydrolase
LDFDGTLSDPALLFQQYVPHLVSQFQAVHGGEYEAWSDATASMLQTLTEEFQDYFLKDPVAEYNGFMEHIYGRSVALVHEAMGLEPPVDRLAFARHTQREALQRTSALYEGVTVQLEALRAEGYQFWMASGQESDFLQAALTGAGLAHLPKQWYGPDLINCAKESAEYYRRIFTEIEDTYSPVIVIDDLPAALLWAQEFGAITIQTHFDTQSPPANVHGVSALMTDWNQLPHILSSLAL